MNLMNFSVVSLNIKIKGIKMTILKRLYIWFWWHFIVKKYEFHSTLDSFNVNHEKLIARRQIAHLLDQGLSIWDLPEHYVKNF